METWPEDPLAYVHDYFGNFRDEAAWEAMEEVKTNNEGMKTQVPELEAKIEAMNEDLARAKRMTKAYKIYKIMDPEATNEISTKAMVNRISGNGKFDTDTKLTKKQFYFLLSFISGDSDYTPPKVEGEEEEAPPEPEGERQSPADLFAKVAEVFSSEEPHFAGDLENELLMKMQEKMRAFVPPEKPAEEAAAE
jgi:hypothetical protein